MLDNTWEILKANAKSYIESLSPEQLMDKVEAFTEDWVGVFSEEIHFVSTPMSFQDLQKMPIHQSIRFENPIDFVEPKRVA